MKPGSSEFGLVVGLVLFVSVIVLVIALAGDPNTCADPTVNVSCGGAR